MVALRSSTKHVAIEGLSHCCVRAVLCLVSKREVQQAFGLAKLQSPKPASIDYSLSPCQRRPYASDRVVFLSLQLYPLSEHFVH